MSERLLYLARHGAAEGAQGRYIGDTDLPLAPRGETQAEQLGLWLAHRPLTAVYCSDLVRARRTAEIAVGERPVPIRSRADLREISMGDWEGLAHSHVASNFPDEYRARGTHMDTYRPPGGESFAQCRERACRAIGLILAETEGDVLVVAHAGINRMLLCHWLGMATADLFRLGQDTGCLNIVAVRPDGARVRSMNLHPQALVSAI